MRAFNVSSHGRLLDLKDFALVWGPIKLPEPAFSFDDDDWDSEMIYAPQEIAEAILAVPGTRLIHEAIPSWESWRARWSEGERYVEFDIAACEFEQDNDQRPGLTVAWGGSNFWAHCFLADILFVWESIRVRAPGIWIHDPGDCRMYSPESFRLLFER